MGRAVIHGAQGPLVGTVRVPGDKSISHRRALLSLYVGGHVTLTGYAAGEDARSSQQCLSQLGKMVTRCIDQIDIEGPAACRSGELDCRNSGTTARLLMGILAGQPGQWVMTGDESLSQRPMERIAVPLRKMGARIELTDGHLPARIDGMQLSGITLDSTLPSAQVKSGILLAGLRAKGITRYREPVATRDHTERLLGLKPDADGWIEINPETVKLQADRLSAHIPGDPSAAIFWITAALMNPGSRVELPGVLVNPVRVPYFDLLKQAGADITLTPEPAEAGEEVATLAIRNDAPLRPFIVRGATAVQLIDEIPALAVLAATIKGRSEFHNVGELRVKESDRLRLVIDGLRRMGAKVDEGDDGFAVEGGAELHGTEIETRGDHRIVMTFGVAALAAKKEPMVVRHAAFSGISYPSFWSDLSHLSPGSVVFEPML